MKNIMQAIIFGFNEVRTWNMMKYALILGLFVSGIWGVVGYFIWDMLIAISEHVLDWIPFSMLCSNGAWMLSTFLWLQLVLLSLVLFFVFFGNFVLRNVSKEKYTQFSFLIAFGSAFFWGIIWFIKGDYIYQKFLHFLTILPFETVDKGLSVVISFYFIYNAIIVTMVFMTSLFSKSVISSVKKRHLMEDDIYKNHLWSSVGYTVRDSFIFLIVSIISFPLMFIPVLNIFVQIALWTWLIKDTMSYDAVILAYGEVNKEVLKKQCLVTWFISIIVALLNFIPVVNIFGPFFGLITLFYYFSNNEK